MGVPTLAEYADPHVLVELALAVERAGWDGFFIWDHLVPDDPATPATDTQVALTAIAAATSRLKIGAMVTPLPRRRPHKVAREIATLQVEECQAVQRVECAPAIGCGGRQ